MDDEHVPLSTSGETATVEYIKPNFEIFNFGAEVIDSTVCFQIMKMEKSLFIWIGSPAEPTFENLSMAINTRYDRLPLGTRLMGANADMTSSILASRLSKKLNQAVFVSYNFSSDRLYLPAIEKRLQEEIRTYPEKFGISS